MDNTSLSAIDLLRRVSPAEAARLRGQSITTVEQELGPFWEWVSPRRKGIRLYIVLGLPPPKLPALEDAPPPGLRSGPSEAGVKPRGVAATRVGRPRKTLSRPRPVPILER
jgi:hypothetical protein